MPLVTRSLLLLCAIVYALQTMDAEQMLLVHLGLWPIAPVNGLVLQSGEAIVFQPWQLLSYGFLHGNTTHLLFNLFALWMFGSELERFWGARPYLLFVLLSIVGAGLAQLLVAALTGNPYPTIGISGGVFGVLLGYGLMFPNRTVMLLIPPIPMKARTLVILYALLELGLGVFARGSGIAHFAHLGGLVSGWLLIQYWRGRLPFKPKRILRY